MGRSQRHPREIQGVDSSGTTAYSRGEWSHLSPAEQYAKAQERGYNPTPPTGWPTNTALPAITGTPTVGQVLTASNGTWTGTPTPTYTRQWLRNGTVISGATGTTYTLVEADEGATIRVRVTGTNTLGSAQATSNPTAAVAPAE